MIFSSAAIRRSYSVKFDSFRFVCPVYRIYRKNMSRWASFILISIIYTRSTDGGPIDVLPILTEDDTSRILETEKCETLGCRMAESWLEMNVESKADPCDDFYELTCGKFGKSSSELNRNIDQYATVKGEMSKRLKEMIDWMRIRTSPKHFGIIKTLYENCMISDDVDNLENPQSKFHAYVHGNTGWPVIIGAKWAAKFPVFPSIFDTSVLTSFFNVQLKPGTVNRRELIPWIEPKHQVLDRAVLRMGFNNEIVQAYYNYMVDVAVIFGASEVAARKELKDAVLAEIEMANDSLPESVRWNMAVNYDRTTVEEFTSQYPHMREFLYSRIVSTYELRDSDTIMVDKSIAHIDGAISRTSQRTLVNLLRWYQIYVKPRYSKKLRKRTKRFKDLLRGFRTPIEKWQKCVALTRSKLNFSFSAMYQKEFITEKTVFNVNEMNGLIRKQFYKIINRTEWLDDTMRNAIYTKIAKMNGNVGFSDKYQVDNHIAAYYEGLELSKRNFQASLSEIDDFQSHIDNIQPRYIPNGTDWTMSSDMLSFEASYNRWYNIYQVPALYLVGQYYDDNRPQFLNYATLGTVIAHEMAHALDLTSISLDAKANSSGTLSSESKREFDKRVQCVIEQYGNYTVDEVGLQLRAYRTLDENLADNLGVEVAYRAYLEWVNQHGTEQPFERFDSTPRQLFWIGMGSSLCKNYDRLELMNVVLSNDRVPVKYRVNGVVANSPEFANDFGCETGSKMNPVKKCRVW